ncbi:pentapeptide repeat-containing protein [Actinomycetes bacterium KLBMP 9797]
MTSDLRADCARCFGLCCVAPTFAASADFAIDKPAGQPCRNLRTDFRCGIHTQLRDRGFAGCTVYDCFGAGQKVAQEMFGGRDWRAAPETATQMFAVFDVVRRLHELLWYLAEAAARPAARPLRGELAAAYTEIETVTRADPETLAALDPAPHWARVNALMIKTSERVRGHARGRKWARRDLVGAKLRGADLRAADLRGAYLIGADLRDADLRLADLVGADLRGADVRGANLSDPLFLTQPQVNAARGNARTQLPHTLTRPPHWPTP